MKAVASRLQAGMRTMPSRRASSGSVVRHAQTNLPGEFLGRRPGDDILAGLRQSLAAQWSFISLPGRCIQAISRSRAASVTTENAASGPGSRSKRDDRHFRLPRLIVIGPCSHGRHQLSLPRACENRSRRWRPARIPGAGGAASVFPPRPCGPLYRAHRPGCTDWDRAIAGNPKGSSTSGHIPQP